MRTSLDLGLLQTNGMEHSCLVDLCGLSQYVVSRVSRVWLVYGGTRSKGMEELLT